MEHPLISGISQLNDEQLLEKISELNNKLLIAYKMGNTDMVRQLQMAIESYKSHQAERSRQNRKDSGHEDKIDIS